MRLFLTVILIVCCTAAYSQSRRNPIIASYGGIFNIPEATVKADESIDYNIVIDVYSGNDDPKEVNWALNNVARMLNLHAIAGVDPDKINVVLAIHGEATYAIISDALYNKKFNSDNPNKPLVKALADAGVQLTVCGQSLMSRKIAADEVNVHVDIATSMLTTVTTYQLKGYAYLKF